MATTTSADVPEGVDRKLSPASVGAGRLRGAIETSFVAIAFAAVNAAVAADDPQTPLAELGQAAFRWVTVLAVAGAAAVAFITPKLAYLRTRYRLDADKLTIRSGVIRHSVKSVPIRRIEHTDVSRDFIDRMFGLATLIVYTAGTTKSSIALPGLAHEDARVLRNRLMDRLALRARKTRTANRHADRVRGRDQGNPDDR